MIVKPKIAVDICNTIVDIDSEISKKGFVRKEGEYFYDLPADWFLKNTDVFRNAKPIDGAVNALWMLSEMYTIVYVTARDLSTNSITEENLFRVNKFPEGRIVNTTDKMAVYEEEGFLFAIEDAPFEIEKYLNGGATVLAIAKDYNMNLPVIHMGWNDLMRTEKRAAV